MTKKPVQNRICSRFIQANRLFYRTKECSPMKTRLFNPADGLFPLALAICSICGHPADASFLLGGYFLTKLCSLCPTLAFSRCAADELSQTRLRGLFTGSLIIVVLGTALSLLAARWINPGWIHAWNKLFPEEFALTPNYLVCWVCAGGLIHIEQLFSRWQDVNSSRGYGLISELVCALLVGTALMCGAEHTAVYVLVAAGIGAVVSMISAFTAGNWLGKPRLHAVLQGPAALEKRIFYPLLCLTVFFFFRKTQLSDAFRGWMFSGFLLGLSLYYGCGSRFRRDEAETPLFATAVCVLSAVVTVVCAALCHAYAPIAGLHSMLCLAFSAMLMMYAHANALRLLSAMAILISAAPIYWAAGGKALGLVLNPQLGTIIAIALAGVALALAIGDIRATLRRLRAMRIRRLAAKGKQF